MKIASMSNPSPLIPPPGPRERGRSRRRPRGAERRAGRAGLRALPAPAERVLGRAWINGREVGGADARYAHLAGSYD